MNFTKTFYIVSRIVLIVFCVALASGCAATYRTKGGSEITFAITDPKAIKNLVNENF